MTTANRDSEFEEILSRFAGPDQPAIARVDLQPAPGQGPGEDGEEGTGPTAEQLREMHEEVRESRCARAQEAIREVLLAYDDAREGVRARLCVEVLRKEGLL